jgi:excinuclease UvrABC nuclease subunit
VAKDAEKSEAMEFEAVAKIRDQIQAVENPEKQHGFPLGSDQMF